MLYRYRYISINMYVVPFSGESPPQKSPQNMERKGLTLPPPTCSLISSPFQGVLWNPLRPFRLAKPPLSPVCLRRCFIINACGSLGEGNINIFLRFYRGAAVSPNRITATQPCAVQLPINQGAGYRVLPSLNNVRQQLNLWQRGGRNTLVTMMVGSSSSSSSSSRDVGV